MKRIFTIGHSTGPIEEFVGLLKEYSIAQLVDIRTIPRSRHNPQYERGNLRATLESEGIQYIHLKELGGLRPSTKDSINNAWRNKSFRNYADYMQTEDFRQGIEKLLSIAEEAQTAIMCAEAVPWRCHRSLVSDALLVRGVKVYDIMSAGKAPEHRMTSFAVVKNDTVTYPGNTT